MSEPLTRGAVRVLRYSAFADVPSGGNRAGIVLDRGRLDEADMLAIAADVGYSETAFVSPVDGEGRFDVRYFSPVAEVPFCGHATIATAVALAAAGAPRSMTLLTRSGPVPVTVDVDEAGRSVATLTSVTPRVEDVEPADLAEALASFGWTAADLDPSIPPGEAFAGARHLIIALQARSVLAAMQYDFDRLLALMTRRTWTTISVVWREDDDTFVARVPFPVGGVVEDPATGAAAAALGAYLRGRSLIDTPKRLTIRQGEDMGRPSLIRVDVDPGGAGIHVSGTAMELSEADW